MAFLLDTDKSSQSREVSPIGSSRFERPLQHSDLESTASEPHSPRSQISSRDKAGIRSRTSTNVTATTNPTSVSTNDAYQSFKPPQTLVSARTTTRRPDVDSWIAQFPSEDDISCCTANEYPDGATLAAVREIPLYDSDGNSCTFGSLFDPATSTHQRQLFVFVRHFYCGACQAYLKALTEGIPQQDYFGISIPTSIIVIGCGQPDLIRQYRKFTGCPWPMYADPTRQLFKKLGMSVSLKIGRERPEYMAEISPLAWMAGQAVTISRSLRDPDGIRKRDVFRGGNPMQIGGEFLFDQGQVVWCHRMRNYRNHAEVGVVRRVLDLDAGTNASANANVSANADATIDGDGSMW